ncbi:MAG: hypothetical protein QM786_01315 [Breznakibacter sp.]
MKLCTIIVLFHPNVEDLVLSLPTFNNETDGVILWKNSIINDDCKKVISSYNNLMVAGNENNLGIATALNRSIQLAKQNGFSHVLTMDQDSYFDEGLILQYRSKINSFSYDDIGVFGINPIQLDTYLFKKEHRALEVSDTITSGSIFKISNFERTGYFEDDLFIDAVDYEYCYRAKSQFGLRTIVFSDILMHHRVGHSEKTKLGFSKNNYSAFRMYFIIRNHLTIWKRYPEIFPHRYRVTLIKDHILFRAVKIILFEKNKLKKIKSIIMGIYHFIIGKLGFYNISSK